MTNTLCFVWEYSDILEMARDAGEDAIFRNAQTYFDDVYPDNRICVTRYFDEKPDQYGWDQERLSALTILDDTKLVYFKMKYADRLIKQKSKAQIEEMIEEYRKTLEDNTRTLQAMQARFSQQMFMPSFNNHQQSMAQISNVYGYNSAQQASQITPLPANTLGHLMQNRAGFTPLPTYYVPTMEYDEQTQTLDKIDPKPTLAELLGKIKRAISK